MVKTFFKWLYGLLHRILQPILLYPLGKLYHDEFQSHSRVGIIQFSESWDQRIRGKVLDVGVGTWTYPHDLLQTHCDCLATDCFEHSSADILSDIYVLIDIFPPQSFDFFLCFDVLERVQRPWVATQQLYDVLMPGVRLLITFFNYRLHGNAFVQDFWRFSLDGLKQLLVKKTGFAAVEISPSEPPDFPFSYAVVAHK